MLLAVLLAGGSSRAMLASARSLVLLKSTAAILVAAMFVGDRKTALTSLAGAAAVVLIVINSQSQNYDIVVSESGFTVNSSLDSASRIFLHHQAVIWLQCMLGHCWLGDRKNIRPVNS